MRTHGMLSLRAALALVVSGCSYPTRNHEVDALMAVGPALLANDPAFGAMVKLVNGRAPVFQNLKKVCGTFAQAIAARRKRE